MRRTNGTGRYLLFLVLDTSKKVLLGVPEGGGRPRFAWGLDLVFGEAAVKLGKV